MLSITPAGASAGATLAISDGLCQALLGPTPSAPGAEASARAALVTAAEGVVQDVPATVNSGDAGLEDAGGP
eukprot:181044-Chlamydomonas_euryale.AAC.1